jgi:hypothetical protein
VTPVTDIEVVAALAYVQELAGDFPDFVTELPNTPNGQRSWPDEVYDETRARNLEIMRGILEAAAAARTDYVIAEAP